jgi:hypothetical protein
MELTQEERDRIYAEEKARIEARQQLEAQATINPPITSSDASTNANKSGLASALAHIGATILMVGIAVIVYYSYFFTTAVKVDQVQLPPSLQQYAPPPGTFPDSVNNIGLMSDKQNGITDGGIAAGIGAFMLIVGLVLGVSTPNSGKLYSSVFMWCIAVAVGGGVWIAYLQYQAQPFNK